MIHERQNVHILRSYNTVSIGSSLDKRVCVFFSLRRCWRVMRKTSSSLTEWVILLRYYLLIHLFS